MAPPSAPPSALIASSSSKPPGPASPRPPQAAGGVSSGSSRGRRHRGGRGQGGSHSGPPGGPQWPSLLNPWTGSIHMWPGSAPSGPHGPPPRVGPPSSPQQALMTGMPLPRAYYPPAPATYYQAPTQTSPSAWSPWDPQSLANAFSTVTLTPPPSSSDWVVDLGATSHIASNPGSPYQERPPSV
ncbi:classical arabinogalactan protein 9-like [Miscanthus floridulus]|uniref:classical arabinogalactan protein 9-like n=1 Tax=Miscanthus floridulus TaxID=154761 RepID=UPI003459FE4B